MGLYRGVSLRFLRGILGVETLNPMLFGLGKWTANGAVMLFQ